MRRARAFRFCLEIITDEFVHGSVADVHLVLSLQILVNLAIASKAGRLSESFFEVSESLV